MTDIPPRPPIRRRASVFHDAQHAAWLRRRVLRGVAIGALALLLVGLLAGGAVAAGFGTMPGADSRVSEPLPSDTLVYDRTGKVLIADLHPPGYQHYQEPLGAMGRTLPAATVAIEDANFWNEPGVDPTSIVRAGLKNLQARAVVEGGSTITQQLVKRRLVGSDRSFTRKLREASLAVRISSDFSKRQILEMYLNEISYGNAAYGAAAAARIYFHVEPAQLDLAQAALLAGLPQDPTLLNPLRHWQAAKDRQRQVLDAMVRAHDISREQADTALVEDLSPPAHLFGPAALDLAPGFTSWVGGEIADRFGRDAVQRGGLRVVTTLDWNLQQLAQRTVTGAAADNRSRGVTDGALTSIDPRTGQVVALVGSAGPDVPGGQYDMAVWPPRNPGSSFKIFTYTAAIESRRYTMVTPVQDAPLTVQAPNSTAYSPRNYDLGYHGTCQLQVCLGNSLNVPAVEVELGTGLPDVVNLARRVGAPPYNKQRDGRYTDNDPVSAFGPSLTLGGYGETPLQMATGAATLAAGGVLREPEGILSATDASGRVRYRAAGEGRQVVSSGTAYVVSQMLSDAANRAMIFGRSTPLSLAGRRAAAKTGTTDGFTDAWTVGYTPSLSTAIWIGNADFKPMAVGSDGMVVAAPAWHQFMEGALDQLGRGDEWFAQPAEVHEQPVSGRTAYFLPGTSPSTQAPALPSWAHLGGGWSTGGQDTPGRTGPGCRSWTVGGASYWSCTAGDSGLPGDPGGG
jgi:membrane peptidoglycan carboxypeptidase